MDSVIFLIDIQSFYASIEKALRPELKNKPIIVCGDPKRRSGVVLAACPIAKSYGIKHASTLWEALLRCPQATVIASRMQLYLNASLHITRILERFSDQVEPYSIDEQFVSMKGSIKLFGPPYEIAKKIQHAIKEEVHVSARIGIGPNKVLSKMACDNFAKKNKDGIFFLTKKNKKKDLWPLPVRKMFGVGHRLERHLKSIGIYTIGELANYPVERLTKRWGINGEVLWLTANGIDNSPVASYDSFQIQKEIGHHMTLPYDYYHLEEIHTVLLELCEEVCWRVRAKNQMAHTVTVSCKGNQFHAPSGFHRQVKIPDPTNETMIVFNQAKIIFQQFWNKEPIRSLGVGLTNLSSDQSIQLNLFEERTKKVKLGYAMDEIKKRFGTTAILRASSLTQAGQAGVRALKIGGHFK